MGLRGVGVLCYNALGVFTLRIGTGLGISTGGL